MKLVVTRQPIHGDAVLGQLQVDGVVQCFTMERASTLTPLGTYVLTLTPSTRCAGGHLWSPDDDAAFTTTCGEWADATHRLLLVNDVPGFSGIRIHSANEPSELDGCTAVGAKVVNGPRLTLSRLALVELMNLVAPALLRGEATTITYRDAR